jgi:hypothetical protein
MLKNISHSTHWLLSYERSRARYLVDGAVAAGADLGDDVELVEADLLELLLGLVLVGLALLLLALAFDLRAGLPPALHQRAREWSRRRSRNLEVPSVVRLRGGRWCGRRLRLRLGHGRLCRRRRSERRGGRRRRSWIELLLAYLWVVRLRAPRLLLWLLWLWLVLLLGLRLLVVDCG